MVTIFGNRSYMGLVEMNRPSSMLSLSFLSFHQWEDCISSVPLRIGHSQGNLSREGVLVRGSVSLAEASIRVPGSTNPGSQGEKR